MDESKMSMMQRNKINYYLRNGEPLPPVRKVSSNSKSNIPRVTIRPVSSKRRSRDTIIKSGVYEREKYYPLHPKVDREKEKEKLQDKMAYNKEIRVVKAKVFKGKDKGDEDAALNRFEQRKYAVVLLEDYADVVLDFSYARDKGAGRVVRGDGGVRTRGKVQVDYYAANSK